MKCFTHKKENCHKCVLFNNEIPGLGAVIDFNNEIPRLGADIDYPHAGFIKHEIDDYTRITFIRELFKLRFNQLILGSDSDELLKLVWADCKKAWDTKPDDC